jgi:hypothetical protein
MLEKRRYTLHQTQKTENAWMHDLTAGRRRRTAVKDLKNIIAGLHGCMNEQSAKRRNKKLGGRRVIFFLQL